MVNVHIFSYFKHVNLGQKGSIKVLLVAQILSHSIRLSFLEGPYANINSVKLSTLKPLLKIPLTVGILGSSHPSTNPFYTNQVNFLLDKTTFTKFNLENSKIPTFLTPVFLITHSY